MDGGLMVTLSMGLTHGAAIGFGVWELWKLRRDRRGGGPGPRDAAPVAPRPVWDGSRKLPDCLVPKPALPVRARELEDA